MLSIENIHTYYGDSCALWGISLEVKDGSSVALLGRNGMGKTTTMRSVIGFSPPRTGSIFYKEEDAMELTPIVEIVHNGTLIIDDIEDNSERRRGKPSIHKLFGIDMSINTANLMYFLPTCIIDSCSLTDIKKNLIYKYFLDNMRRLHLCQGLDILGHKDH